MNFFDKYIMSISQLILLLVLSPAITDFYHNNVPWFIFLLVVISFGNFTLETIYNRKNYEYDKKDKGISMGKKVRIYQTLVNTIIAGSFILFIFE